MTLLSTDVRLHISTVLLVLYPKTTGTNFSVYCKQNSRSEKDCCNQSHREEAVARLHERFGDTNSTYR